MVTQLSIKQTLEAAADNHNNEIKIMSYNYLFGRHIMHPRAPPHDCTSLTNEPLTDMFSHELIGGRYHGYEPQQVEVEDVAVAFVFNFGDVFVLLFFHSLARCTTDREREESSTYDRHFSERKQRPSINPYKLVEYCALIYG